ncbi:Ankyrin repeat domain containing protein 50 [Fusarium agapanthi]|uniref:Ankyrin repeat domain containing protein 50 n=1 Tax=Fusarium agapanthi TaxID=1803897 RepID=A0A9P5EF07_9HYPO|nr:Ankyrin repeat domain containing protein 50 [Fusarium agapanthi]
MECLHPRGFAGLSHVEEIPDEPPQQVVTEESGAKNKAILSRLPVSANKTSNIVVLEKMIAQDCNIEVRFEDGSQDLTPVLLAYSKLNATTVKLLAKSVRAGATGHKGQIGLHLCQSSKFQGRRIAKLLLEDSWTPALDANSQDDFHMTAAHIAARIGDVRILEYLFLGSTWQKGC